tara:strand:+ start:537 stop:944 length:408 start_codon:yes stop_codon:yes gene_type:complete
MTKLMLTVCFLMSLWTLNAQESTFTYTADEVAEIANTLKGYETKIDSLQNVSKIDKEIVENLENQIYMYISKSKNDSLLVANYQMMIDELNSRIQLYEERLKVVTPKWYDNKYLWMFYGVSGTALSVWMAGQLTN